MSNTVDEAGHGSLTITVTLVSGWPPLHRIFGGVLGTCRFISNKPDELLCRGVFLSTKISICQLTHRLEFLDLATQHDSAKPLRIYIRENWRTPKNSHLTHHRSSIEDLYQPELYENQSVDPWRIVRLPSLGQVWLNQWFNQWLNQVEPMLESMVEPGWAKLEMITVCLKPLMHLVAWTSSEWRWHQRVHVHFMRFMHEVVIPSMLLSVLMPSLPVVGCISLLTKADVGHSLQLLEECYGSNVEIPQRYGCWSIPCSSGEHPKDGQNT